jgi:hypothetical protein
MSGTLRSTVRTAVVTSAVALAGAACSTPTAVTSEWKDPSYTAGPLHNVLVFGARLDDNQRRTLEDGFVSALNAHGVRATPSYTIFSGPLPERSEARATIQKGGFDGVLVSTMRGVKERTYVEPGAGWGGSFYGDYWGAGWGGPAVYTQTDEYVKFETTIWDPSGDGKLIWSAVTQTENPMSGHDFTRSLVHKLMPAMLKDGVVPAGTGPQVSSARLTP